MHEAGYQVHLQTSGAYPHTGTFAWICLSPKKTNPALEEWFLQADELKVIVYNKHDYQWAEDHAARMEKKLHLYLQPEWSKKAEVVPGLTEYVMQHPHWKISLQTHKYLGIP